MKRITAALFLWLFALHPVVAQTVGPQGLGPVRFGMTLSQLSRVLGEELQAPADPEDRGCFYVDTKRFPEVWFMIEGGRLQRIDVRSTAVATSQGIRVGDSVEKVKRVYGPRLTDEPHHYSGPEDRYLTVKLNAKVGVRFETTGPIIGNFYVGGLSQIEYVEGCL